VRSEGHVARMGNKKLIRILGWEVAWKRTIWRPRRECEYNTKIDLRYID